jgi:hypothetical protein
MLSISFSPQNKPKTIALVSHSRSFLIFLLPKQFSAIAPALVPLLLPLALVAAQFEFVQAALVTL